MQDIDTPSSDSLLWSVGMIKDKAVENELMLLKEELQQERLLRERAELLLKEERQRTALARQSLNKTQKTLNQLLSERGDEQGLARENLLSTRHSFLMRMSHELRTPLNAIIGYTDLLLEEGDALKEQERKIDLEKIHEASHALLHMIDDVLEISRLESGRLSLQMANFDIPNLLRDVTRESLPYIQRNGNEIKLRHRPCERDFFSDPGKIRHIMRRVFQEACRWTTNQMLLLSVYCEQDDGANDPTLCLELSGWTVPKEGQQDKNGDLLRLFMDTEERQNPLYLSFGLFIVQRFCMLLGGDIQYELRNGASVLCLRLPSLRDMHLWGG